MLSEKQSVPSFDNRPVYERLHNKLHYHIFIRHKIISLFIAIVLHVGTVIVLGEKLAISANYFVIIPVLAAALSFGLPGGIIGGALGLPMNLLLFHLIGHPEYSPASKIIAELSGIIVGSAFGLLGNYFSRLNREIQHRMETEENLRRVIAGKEVLFQEMHHRVKNNLNIIKSLVRLQINRSENDDFIRQSRDLENRICSIALVHDQLYTQGLADNLEAGHYLSLLTRNILDGSTEKEIDYIEKLPDRPFYLESEQLVPLSLLINEVITNSLKYAVPVTEKPVIRFAVSSRNNTCKISISDNGPGFQTDHGHRDGLGLKLVKTLSRQLDGELELKSRNGTCVKLTFQYGKNNEEKS
ncbi:MAG: sensor histidine kinase [Spirochaetales bacterium]|nr:sensor histidine kinase [Spirochaetales bacterium]